MGSLRIIEDQPLAPLTTFEVGGAARFFADVRSEEELIGSVGFARRRGLALFVLGGGSNVLFGDSGFDGLVIRIGIRGVEFAGAVAIAAAGEDWDGFCATCVARGLAGVECLSGIPGTVGGTPVQNVGAYGQEVSETIETVRAYDLESERFVDLRNRDCGFGYRKSIFNTVARGRYVVTAVTFRLEPGGAPKIVYKDLRICFGDSEPTLAEVRAAVRRIRGEKGMLVRQGGPDSRSAGSFFKNPVVAIAHFELLRKRFEDLPGFPSDDGSVKIPAAWLIERAGFEKGYRRGRAGLSTRHTLALTNRGNAIAAEIRELEDLIRRRVHGVFGVELAVEPVLVTSER
jgi:UDP-N-acetylmuramate dehydrogenase